MSERIHTDKAPAAIGPYSQAVSLGNLLFTSGQIALDPETGKLDGDDIASQTRRVCENLKAVLSAGGSSFEKVIKTVCFLSDIADFKTFNGIYAEYFIGKPARSCVAVKDLPAGALVEIEVIAEKD